MRWFREGGVKKRPARRQDLMWLWPNELGKCRLILRFGIKSIETFSFGGAEKALVRRHNREIITIHSQELRQA